MMNVIRKNMCFLVPWFLLVLVCLALMIAIPRIDLHIMLNRHHNEESDVFFKYFTNIGGNIPWIVCVVMIIWRMWMGAYIASGQVLSTLIVQPLKYAFNHPRPKVVFEEAGVVLPTVQGIDLPMWLSFPSGHSTAIFAMMFAICTLVPKWWEKVICLAIAITGAYSRVYLSFHFLDDITAGSVIGVVSVLAVTPFFKISK
ncbi:MAG: phosphatase PAP2 family protein [Paludibacteraceae bacterium]|nr:phosphatase PAP2 family protein [Paludibacteraceae bacterium]